MSEPLREHTDDCDIVTDRERGYCTCPAGNPKPEPLSREQVREALRAYPNLEAVLIGCVSGHVTEWPMIRHELVNLVSDQRARIASLEEQLRLANVDNSNTTAQLATVKEERGRLRVTIQALKDSEADPFYQVALVEAIRNSWNGLSDALRGWEEGG